MLSFMKFLTESEAKIQMINTRQGDKVQTAYFDNEEHNFTNTTGIEVIRILNSWSEKYLQWLVNEYIKNNFTIDTDKERILSILDTFDKYKSKLKFQDINKYTPQSLDDDIQSIDLSDTPSARQAEKKIKEDLLSRKEAEIFHKDSNFLVYKINTEKASCYFGRGTQWCTAAREDNKFDHYTDRGEHLYIILTPDKEKHQIYFPTIHDLSDDMEYSITITNAQDKEISYKNFLVKYPHFKPILLDIAREEKFIPLSDINTIIETLKSTIIKKSKIPVQHILEGMELKKTKVDDFHEFISFLLERNFTPNEIIDHLNENYEFSYTNLIGATEKTFLELVKMVYGDINDSISLDKGLNMVVSSSVSDETASKYIRYAIENTLIKNKLTEDVVEILEHWVNILDTTDYIELIKKAKIEQEDIIKLAKDIVVYRLKFKANEEKLIDMIELLDKYYAEEFIELVKEYRISSNTLSAITDYYESL